MRQDPRMAEWLEEMLFMQYFHFYPDDQDQREFMWEFIPEQESDE